LQVLVSLHDVTPAHHRRLEQAETLFSSLGVTRLAYFVVPNYHRCHPIATDRAFHTWCERRRRFSVDWVLHGYYHLDWPPVTVASPLVWLKQRLLTAGEGEFLCLDVAEQRQRLLQGRAAMQASGTVARSFVAPAWLFNDALLPILAEMRFTYTEDHLHVIEVGTRTARRCPAITWASRTAVRRVGSAFVCPALLHVFRREPAIRIAVHPLDMDHEHTVEQIRRLLGTALERRTCVSQADLFSS
jgi:predicted deacetylase